MSAHTDYLVIGGGAMGSATSHFLAAAGHEVVLLERFDPGHVQGASHGSTRNFNPAYDHPEYVRFLQRSQLLWDEVSQQAGVQLLHRTGLVNHGDVPGQRVIHRVLGRAGFDSELLSISEAQERFSGMRFETETLYIPQGGQLNADKAVSAFQQLAAANGAEIRHGARVLRIEVLGDELASVTVQDASGEHMITARHVVVTAGAWTQALLGTTLELPRIHVTEEHPVHFALKDRDAFWPGFNHTLDPARRTGSRVFAPVYGMHTPGEGIKVGWHGSGAVIDPEHRPHLVIEEQLSALQDYAARWLPGVDPQLFEPVSCTYANTEDEHFILDRFGPVTVGAGFSGQGFKFVPAIGEHLALLASGRTGTIPAFSAGRTIDTPIFLNRRAQAGLA
ncbi:FAD-dependent oxidoreductase [Glutamicibacter sp.]|uniref:FAD-dependent oxidoreductase n=1 Tax=Glutamicibacter sp. TaxID=1931995 RepID=UPI0028BDDE99|nr:FAD-dependent oxidoreductase [Glutamicibacter sp.]